MSSFVEYVLILTTDGKVYTGTLQSYDAMTNLILTSAEERIFSADMPVQKVPLGLFVIRGDTVCVVGEVDVSLDQGIEWTQDVQCPPIRSIKM